MLVLWFLGFEKRIMLGVVVKKFHFLLSLCVVFRF